MSIRSVDFVSRKACEALERRDDLLVISVTEPGMYRAKLALPEDRILRLEFHDVEGTPDEDDPWIRLEFEQASAIVAFVRRYQAAEDAFDLVTHCKAGISRSAAIALWVHAATGADMPRRPMAGFANKHVVAALEQASGVQVHDFPRALLRREKFEVSVLRDFDGGLTLVTAENVRSGERFQVEGPVAEEGALVGVAISKVAGIQDPPPAAQIQDWDHGL